MKSENIQGVFSYMDHAANTASFDAFNRHEEAEILLSAEALPENSSFLSFAAFAKDHPQRFFQLVSHLRPEFQELCIEYYVLRKSQSFLGQVHGFIQTRVWQALRLIEQAIGSMIVLGIEPSADVIRPILDRVGLENTDSGSLTDLIVLYAKHRNYTQVANLTKIPVATVRKIFRPTVAVLLANKDIEAVSVGAYLRSMTHQASLTKTGLSKSCLARLSRVKDLHFVAPSADNSPLISFGDVSRLGDIPWCMLEISSEHRMAQISEILHKQSKTLFGKKPVQIFAPVTPDGELRFGYLFARSISPRAVRVLTRIRGISEMSAAYNDEGAFSHAVTIPHQDVLKMVSEYTTTTAPDLRRGDFVEILTGRAARYCGIVTSLRKSSNKATILVTFPTGRKFIVKADESCVKILPKVPAKKQAFWGIRVD